MNLCRLAGSFSIQSDWSVVTVLIDTAESLTCLDKIGSLFGDKSPVQT
jgi:hypothetical protein